MTKSMFCILSVAAIIGVALTSTAASAAVMAGAAPSHARASHARASHAPASNAPASNAPAGGDPDTTLTFTVTSGLLSITAPGAVDLGSGAPGTTISGQLGPVTVTDDRALLSADWTVTASSGDFTTGGGTPDETIAADEAGYDPGAITSTGTIDATGTPITLSGTPAPVVTGTDGDGDNTATWDPTISVAVPANAVGGIYTGTLTQSFLGAT